MKASELFGVAVRTIGFLIVIFGLWELWGGVENMVENIKKNLQKNKPIADHRKQIFIERVMDPFNLPEV